MGRWALLSGDVVPTVGPILSHFLFLGRDGFALGIRSGDLPCNIMSSLFQTLGFLASLEMIWWPWVRVEVIGGWVGRSLSLALLGMTGETPSSRSGQGNFCRHMTHTEVLCKTIKGRISYCYQWKGTRMLWARLVHSPYPGSDRWCQPRARALSSVHEMQMHESVAVTSQSHLCRV